MPTIASEDWVQGLGFKAGQTLMVGKLPPISTRFFSIYRGFDMDGSDIQVLNA